LKKRFCHHCSASHDIVLRAADSAPQRAPAFETAPEIAYESTPNFLKLPPNFTVAKASA
jgi:hypothetical protein